MCKKVLVGVAVAVAALVAVNTTVVGSHFRLWARKAAAQARERVTPEVEIERLRMELADLKGQDERFIDKVARQALAAEKLEAQADGLRADLTRREKGLKEMHAALATKDAQVAVRGERYPRERVTEQMKMDFVALEADEQVLQSREAHLKELRKGLALNRGKLSELRVQRERMATELQRLETALAQERRAQAEQERTLDDGSYRRLTAEIAAVKERVELLKKKRELRGEAAEGPVRASERQREEEAKLRERMEQRLSVREE